ncbi:DUF31 family protein [Mycoplasmopsis cynos]|nr:DUF31 family protein [Mycoplasmopsis cynos]UWV77934.1 DUF31 family protein [Mycoplasmopsis cynos]
MDASHQDFLKDKQEFADFAILEIDFSKIKSGNDDAGNYCFSTYTTQAPEQFAANLRKIEDDLRKANENESSLKIAQSNIAKFITNDYANLEGEHDKVEFIAQDYLHNYEKIDRPLIVRKNMMATHYMQLVDLVLTLTTNEINMLMKKKSKIKNSTTSFESIKMVK